MLTFPRLFAAVVTIIVRVVLALSRSRADLILENLALRQQLTTLRRKRPRPSFDDTGLLAQRPGKVHSRG